MNAETRQNGSVENLNNHAVFFQKHRQKSEVFYRARQNLNRQDHQAILLRLMPIDHRAHREHREHGEIQEKNYPQIAQISADSELVFQFNLRESALICGPNLFSSLCLSVASVSSVVDCFSTKKLAW